MRILGCIPDSKGSLAARGNPFGARGKTSSHQARDQTFACRSYDSTAYARWAVCGSRHPPCAAAPEGERAMLEATRREVIGQQARSVKTAIAQANSEALKEGRQRRLALAIGLLLLVSILRVVRPHATAPAVMAEAAHKELATLRAVGHPNGSSWRRKNAHRMKIGSRDFTDVLSLARNRTSSSLSRASAHDRQHR